MLSLGLVGCGGANVVVHHGAQPDIPWSAVTQVSPGATPLSSLPPAPRAADVAALTVTDPAGRVIRLLDLRGRQGTVVAFWATWCDACRTELSSLEELAPILAGRGVTLVLVAYQQPVATAAAWLRERKYSLSTYADLDGSAHDGLRLVGIPATAVLAADGSVATRLEGAGAQGLLRQALDGLGSSAQ